MPDASVQLYDLFINVPSPFPRLSYLLRDLYDLFIQADIFSKYLPVYVVMAEQPSFEGQTVRKKPFKIIRQDITFCETHE